MKKIILISGKARSGKDTLADYLKKQLELKGEKIAITCFAKDLKRLLMDFYGWDGVTKDKYWRTQLQKKGTDETQIEKKLWNIWAKRTAEDIQIIENDFDYILIPDCRFRKEITYMQSAFPDNTEALRIIREDDFDNGLTDEQKNHISETDLDNFTFDHYICAKQGIGSLYNEVNKYIIKSCKA